MGTLDDLKAELLAGHPVTGAYSLDNEVAAGQINALNRTRNVSSLSGDRVFQATDTQEFGGLTEQKRLLWLSFCGRESIDPFGSANVAFVQFIFGAGATLSALTAMRTEVVSRAQELGFGRVFPGTVEQARAL